MKKPRDNASFSSAELPQNDAILSVNIAINGKVLEAIAGAEIWPGMFVRRLDAQYVVPHTQEDTVPRLVAVENARLGKPVSTPYSENDTVHLYHCLPGDVFYGVVSPTSSHIDAGDFLACASDGQLRLAAQSFYRPPNTTDRAIVGMSVGFETTFNGMVYIATEVW